MFARTVSMRVKPGRAPDLAAVMEAEIIPRLWREEGLQDALILIAPGGVEAIGLSLWSHRDDAEQYERNASVQVMQRLAEFLDEVGNPRMFRLELDAPRDQDAIEDRRLSPADAAPGARETTATRARRKPTAPALSALSES